MACAPGTGHLQDVGDPLLGYRIPDGGGVITEWKFRAGPAGGSLAFQVLESAGTFQYYTVVSESEVMTLTPSAMNSIPARTTVAERQLIGLRIVSGSPDCRYSGYPTGFDETSEASPPALPGGGPTLFGTDHDGNRLNVAAVLESDDDRDGFGDQSQDACSDNAERIDDCVDPTVTLEKGVTKKRNATFAFSSDEPGTFECRLDRAKFKTCTSPVKFKKLKREKHHFLVRAVDLNGNRSYPEHYSWVVKKKS